MKCFDCKKYSTIKDHKNSIETPQCGEGHKDYFNTNNNCPYYDEKDIVQGDWGNERSGHVCQIQCGKCGEYQQMWLGHGFVEGLVFKCCKCGKLNEINSW